MIAFLVKQEPDSNTIHCITSPLTDVPGKAVQGLAYGAGDEDALVMMREG